MTHERHPQQFDPGNYPALLEFLPAYLHEDFVEEYDSAPKAVEALVADASGDQIRDVREEWEALRKAFSGKPLDDLQHALAKLGAAWRPLSEEELRGVDEILHHASG